MWRHGTEVRGWNVGGWKADSVDSEVGGASSEVGGWNVGSWRADSADSEVGGLEVGDWKTVSEDGETPPPGVLTQGCDFMGVIFRRNVRM